MPISSGAIERFLEYQAPTPKAVKWRPVDELVARVERAGMAPYKPKTIPRPHQLEALAFSLEQPCSLLFMKMRLGKSKTFLDWASMLKAGERWEGRGLILTPRPIVSDVWASEIEKHSNLTYRLVNTRLDDLYEALDSGCDLIVLCLTGLQHMLCPLMPKRGSKQGNARQLDRKLAAEIAGMFSLACVDEIHKCSNPTSLSFKIAAALTEQIKYFMGLTGTPMGRDPYKIWAQAFLADRGRTLGSNYFFFQHAFGVSKKNPFTYSGFKLEFDKRKLPALERKLEPISLSYGWDGYIDMPPVTYNEVPLPLSDEQEEAYRSTIRKLIESKGQRQQVEAVFVRLRQISSGFLPYLNDNGDERMRFFKRATKLEWLEEFFADAPREAKLLIFHEFIASGQMMVNHLKLLKIPHLWLYGGVRDKSALVREFQNSKKHNVLICNSAIGELSLDLSAADYMCFYESPVSPTVRQQAEARPMSPFRKDRPLSIDDLVCSTVERRILGFVREGRAMLASLIYQEALEGGLL